FSSGALTSATSGNVVVSPAVADRLTFVTQPNSAQVGSPFGIQPIIKSQDQFGNDSVGGLPATLSVTVALTSGSGPLQGNSIFDIGRAAGNGTVTFTNLRIDSAGSGKQLTGSATGLLESVSGFFTVSKADQTISFGTLPDKTYGNAPFSR